MEAEDYRKLTTVELSRRYNRLWADTSADTTEAESMTQHSDTEISELERMLFEVRRRGGRVRIIDGKYIVEQPDWDWNSTYLAALSTITPKEAE